MENKEKVDNICFSLIFFIFITTFTTLYGYYAILNPDLQANDGAHCFVEPGYTMTPLPIGVLPSAEAIDVTKQMLNLFLWLFIANFFGFGAMIMGFGALKC